MSIEEMEEVIENLRDQLEFTQRELETIRDEKDKQISDLEFRVQSTRTQVEGEFRSRLKAQEKDFKSRIFALNAEIDKLRQAFSGDAGGWEQVERGNKTVYVDKNTGQEQETEPEALFIAKAMQKVDEAEKISTEMAELKVKFKATEMKKKEYELAINKLKTEMNSLKTMEKGWKDSAVAVHKSMNVVFKQVDAHFDQIMTGLKGFQRSQHRMKNNIPKLGNLTSMIAKLQQKIGTQASEIKEQNGTIRTLTDHLADKTRKVERLSAGIEDEVERLCKPMRDRLADAMVQLMKAKMGRAQDRREVADLWPKGHMMPTLLMKSRSLTEKERTHRIERIKRNNASLALSLEIRSNMTESKLWEVKYDDYGRAYYQHMKTGQVSEEEPEIVSYKPPPGRDEMGNIVVADDSASWSILCDGKGEVCYEHKETKEISYFPPEAYVKIPPAKSPQVVVGEAARLVLDYIKSKISAYLEKMASAGNADPKEIVSNAGIKDNSVEEKQESVAIPEEDLSIYLYDIQTVELLADAADNGPKEKKEENFDEDEAKTDDKVQNSDDSFLKDYIGPELKDMDQSTLTVENIRQIMENLTNMETNLEKRLVRVHANMKEFSYVLLDVMEKRREEMEREAAERIMQEKLERSKRRDEKRAARREEKLRRRAEEGVDEDGADSVSLSLHGSEDLSSIAGNTLGSTIMSPKDKNKGDEDLAVESPRPVQASASHHSDKEAEVELDEYGEPIIPNVETDADPDRPQGDVQSVTSELTGAGGGSVVGGMGPVAVPGSLPMEDPEKVVPVVGELSIGPPFPEDPHSFTVDDVADRLVSLSLYCGFANLRIDEAPEDINYEYHFDLDEQNKQMDDKWLSMSFFISTTKAHVDAVREQINRQYDPVAGALKVDNLHSIRMTEESLSTGESLYHEKFASVLPSFAATQSNCKHLHSIWRGQQLVAEVLRHQLQIEVIRDAYKGREINRVAPSSTVSHLSLVPADKPDIPTVDITIKKIVAINIPHEEYSLDQRQYIRLSFGTWSVRTPVMEPKRYGMRWENIDINVAFPTKNIFFDELVVEAFDESPLLSNLLISSGKKTLSDNLAGNIYRDLDLKVELKDDKGRPSGEVTLTIRAGYSKPQQGRIQDPELLLHNEVLSMHSKTYTAPDGTVRRANILEDDLSGVFPSLKDEKSQFSKLVADLRGDGDNHVKMMIGDVEQGSLLRLGHRVNGQTVKPLPSTEHAVKVMEMKTRLRDEELKASVEEIDKYNQTVLNGINERIVALERQLGDAKKKKDDLFSKASDTRASAIALLERASDVRFEAPKPPEPNFADRPTIDLVPTLPKVGGVDAKGKKLKSLPSANEKDTLKGIENGEFDGLSEWNFEPFFPSGGQQKKLKKAIDARNVVVLELREKEAERRVQEQVNWKEAMEKWDVNDKKRQALYSKMKKDLRRVNLRTDCFNERVDRVQNDVNQLEWDIAMWKELLELHTQSRDRFIVLRGKVVIEYHRHKLATENLRSKLLRILDARRRALDVPGGAQNHFEFEDLRQRSEKALKTLRFEVVEVKQALVEEGVRLRTILHEETAAARSELMRTRMLVEMLRQKTCIEKIVERHRYEVIHLFEDLEKLKVAEAEKDDIGIETIDDLGERYRPEKNWQSPEITEIMKPINAILGKIELTEGMVRSAVNSQKCVLESICIKWGSEYLTYRDSWIENSDYERSKKVMSDMISWVSSQRDKLSHKEGELNKYRQELFSELRSLHQQNDISLENQGKETESMAEATLRAIKVVKDKLELVREQSRIRLLSLDKSVTEISRDSQKLREEVLRDRVHYEEKITTLLSLIATLQTSLQTLSARIDVIVQEKEKVVTVAKLQADRLKSQLRGERQHSTNLLFIIHSQKGFIYKLQDKLKLVEGENEAKEQSFIEARKRLRTEIWEQVFPFTQLCTNVDALFEFFALRMASLSGSRKSVNDALNRNNAAIVFAALCRSPRPLIRKLAARALGGMGWDGFVETRILLWESVMQWKLFKANTLKGNNKFYKNTLDEFIETGKEEAIISVFGTVDEFEPTGNVSLRTLIKQRRQWALRATRRNEGPNRVNQRLLNMKDYVIPTLLHLCKEDGRVDWEIVRNAALALSVASFDPQNHHDMSHDDTCVRMLVYLCKQTDIEIVTHAAITIANLCHKDENAQLTFGAAGAIEVLLGLLQSNAVDALEAASAALSNMTCLCDENCRKIMEVDGVKFLVKLIVQAYSENLLNLDQNEEVQANAAEVLANVSRFNNTLTVQHFNVDVIDNLIIMCASANLLVKRHVPLAIGNISQNETCRILVGDRGGVEAMFLILEDDDNSIQANALWALCNLMWHPSNQERAGRFMVEVIGFMDSTWLPVKSHALILLANMVYYNNSNRIRFLEIEGSTEKIIEFIVSREDKAVVEASLRALLSLSYLDQVALWLGTDGNCIPLFISLIQHPIVSRDAMRYSLEIICNLCIHHVNRRKILDNAGIEAVVSLHTDVDPHIRETSIQIIEHLEDVTPPEVLTRVKQQIGIDRMVQLASNNDPMVRAVAAESIGEEVWRNPKLQKKATASGGIEAMLGILSNKTEAVESLLPSLWSLRNILHDSFDAKSVFESNKGVHITLQALSRSLSGCFLDQSEKIFEGCLVLLSTAILGNEKNARRLLVLGLEIIMDIAEEKLADTLGADMHVRRGLQSESVVSLAKSILQILGPYNYVVCRNCQRKQQLKGTHCYNCGSTLLVDVSHKKKGLDHPKTSQAAIVMSASVPSLKTVMPLTNEKGATFSRTSTLEK